MWSAIPSAIGLATWHPTSLSRCTSLFLLLWTAHPTAIGLIPSLSSLIPDWPTQSTGLLYNRGPFALGSLIPDDGGSTYLWNVGRQLFYTAVHPRRQFWTWIKQLQDSILSQDLVKAVMNLWQETSWSAEHLSASQEKACSTDLANLCLYITRYRMRAPSDRSCSVPYQQPTDTPVLALRLTWCDAWRCWAWCQQ